MMVVFKPGGSLLTLPGLANKLRAVVAQRPGQRCLVVSGGGAAADVVRDLSQVHGLSEETAHWLAIASLDLNRSFLESILAWRSTVSRRDAEQLWSHEPSPLLLDLTRFLKAEEAGLADVREALPHHWDVTSDSLAAWVALRWPAGELVLLKSVAAPLGLSVEEAGRQRLVDPWFHRLANRLPRVSWCNLRAASIVIESWITNQD
jgi:aspartokinase-like uncharacterized kinase